MKNTFKKSFVLFTLMAAFAMIFVGCSKKDNDSNNNGGIPTGNYGTLTVGDQTYTIRIAGYEISYNNTIQADALTIAFADATTENANIFSVPFPGFTEIPTGTYPYSTISAEGQCYGILKSSDNNVLYCTSGSITITKNGSNYKVESEGTVNTLLGTANTAMSFSVDFNGPINHAVK